MKTTFWIEEWDEAHPRWPEFVTCLENTAPDQASFVFQNNSHAHQAVLLVALQLDKVVGFLRFVIQLIGPEVGCPPLVLDGVQLTEAKIIAFAVQEEARGQGIGTKLQKQAIQCAQSLGCYQVASYSSYSRDANFHIKLSLGFAAQPEIHGDNHRGVYFLMPLHANGMRPNYRRKINR